MNAPMVPPDYGGGGLVNLVATLASHFAVVTGHGPVRGGDELLAGIDRIVLWVCDALGALQLEHHLEAGVMPWTSAMLASGDASLGQLTTVFPSTTAAALSSLHTGATPAEHGVVGYSLWLGERAGITDMLRSQDRYTKRAARIPPSPVPSLASRLVARGVCCRAVNAAAFADSALTRWHFGGSEYQSWYSVNTLPSLLAAALDVRGPATVTAYWPDHDTVCHAHGPLSPEAADEVAVLDLVLARFVQAVPHTGRTLLLLIGDHGQKSLDPEMAVNLRELGIDRPAGERRAVYLRSQPGLASRLAPYAETMPTERLWQSGWFGGPPADEAFRTRIGDVLAVPRGSRQLVWTAVGDRGPTAYRGGHGGWSAEEMLVPLLAIRL